MDEQDQPAGRTRWGRVPGRAPVGLSPRRRARSRAIRRGVVAGLGLLLIGSVLKLPLLVLSPGPTYNTIGDVGGVPMITISGTTTYPTDGALDMVTVAERGGSSGGVFLAEALVGWFSGASTVLPRESVYGPDTTGEEISTRNDQAFALSQSDAVGAALDELDIPADQSVVVALVTGGSPADGIVRAGDQIVAVNGHTVNAPAQVGAIVREGAVGDTVTLDVLRAETPDGQRTPEKLSVVAGPSPEDPTQPYLGIQVQTWYEAPFDLEFNLDDVGGPSAGLMFSMAIVDMLTPGAMTGGAHVAGTGTIDPAGNVGPIGGIRQKMRGAQAGGATLFLAPVTNCSEVVDAIPDGLEVAAVATLADARAVVQARTKNPAAPLPACPAVLAGR